MLRIVVQVLVKCLRPIFIAISCEKLIKAVLGRVLDIEKPQKIPDAIAGAITIQNPINYEVGLIVQHAPLLAESIGRSHLFHEALIGHLVPKEIFHEEPFGMPDVR
jgi:hypothetical protein